MRRLELPPTTPTTALVGPGALVVRPVLWAAAAVISWATGCVECHNDRDCIDQAGSSSQLCVDGSCTEGQVDEVPRLSCDDDDGCADGESCLGSVCVVVPTCLQLESNFVAVREDTGARGDLRASTDGCEITLAIDFGSDRIDLSARRLAADGTWDSPTGFRGGAWDPATRVGVVDGPFGTRVHFGTVDFVCDRADDGSDGGADAGPAAADDDVDEDCGDQIDKRCRTACEDGFGCDDGTGCESDGFCRARTRGTCR
jgi:hypothetical protein